MVCNVGIGLRNNVVLKGMSLGCWWSKVNSAGTRSMGWGIVVVVGRSKSTQWEVEVQMLGDKAVALEVVGFRRIHRAA